MPNEQTGTNGKQPFGSESNQTSAMVASRRSPWLFDTMSRTVKINIAALSAIGLLVLYLLARIYFVEGFLRARFPQKVRARANPEELRAWALACLQRWDTNSPYNPQPVTNTHSTLRGLWIHGPITEMYQADEQDTAHVTI